MWLELVVTVMTVWPAPSPWRMEPDFVDAIRLEFTGNRRGGAGPQAECLGSRFQERRCTA